MGCVDCKGHRTITRSVTAYCSMFLREEPVAELRRELREGEEEARFGGYD